jgi:hypothetical protein
MKTIKKIHHIKEEIALKIFRKKCRVFLNALKQDDYESVLNIYEPDKHDKNPYVMRMLGIIYGDPMDSKLYNPRMSLKFSLRAANSRIQEYEPIGDLYRYGAEGQIDLLAAIYWYEKAIEKGEKNAAFKLATLYQEYDPRYKTDVKFRTSVDSLILRYLENLDSALNHLHAAEIYARYQTDNYAIIAFDHYRAAIELDKNYFYAGAFALKALALRAFLGIGTQPCLNTTQKYIQQYSSIGTKCEGLKWRISSGLSHINEGLEYFNQNKTDDHISYCRFFNDIQKGVMSFETAKKILNNSSLTTGLISMLWGMSYISDTEKWSNREEWKEMFGYFQAQKMGIKVSDLHASTLSFGPLYNKLNKHNLPILGAFTDSSCNTDNRYFTPETGLSEFKHIFTKKGLIGFKCEDSQKNAPSLLLPNDFDVVLALMYGDDQPIWPYFSLERACTEIKDVFNLYSIKLSKPSGLINTPFGQTLYNTDILIGALAWHTKLFDIGNEKDGVSNEMAEQFQLALQKIYLSGGACAGFSAGRIMLLPERVPLTIKKTSNQDWRIVPHFTKMAIDGSFIDEKVHNESKGKNGHSEMLNDTRYSHGRIAQNITDMLPIISEAIPVFKRANELMKILYSVHALRTQTDFWPAPDLLKKYKKDLINLQNEPPIEQRLCTKLPSSIGI